MEHVVIVGELVFSLYLHTGSFLQLHTFGKLKCMFIHCLICYTDIFTIYWASFLLQRRLAINLGLKVLYNVHDDTKLEPVQVCQEDKSG